MEAAEVQDVESNAGFMDDIFKPAEAEQPKKRGRKPGSTNTGSRSRFNLSATKDTLEKGLRFANTMFVQFQPMYAPLAIHEDEVKPLTEALAGEIAASPRLQQMFSSVGKASPHVALALVLGQMTMTRYLMFKEIDKLKKIQAAERERYNDTNDSIQPPEYVSPVPVGTGGTYGGDRGNGDGENVTGFKSIRH